VDAALRTAAARFRAALPSEPPREHLVLRWLQRTYGEATGWGALVPRVHVASFGGVMLPSAHGYLQLQVRSASFLSPPSLSLSGAELQRPVGSSAPGLFSTRGARVQHQPEVSRQYGSSMPFSRGALRHL
jgi:hypothetical protein